MGRDRTQSVPSANHSLFTTVDESAVLQITNNEPERRHLRALCKEESKIVRRVSAGFRFSCKKKRSAFQRTRVVRHLQPERYTVHPVTVLVDRDLKNDLCHWPQP